MRHPAITVTQWDGSEIALTLCTCPGPWIEGYEYGDTG